MTRTGSPRILGYAAIAAIGLVGALALRRPELASTSNVPETGTVRVVRSRDGSR